MGEILQINFGSFGNNIGQQYLNKLIEDHHLETDKESEICFDKNLNVSFEESSNKMYRGIFIDFGLQNIYSGFKSQQVQYINPNQVLALEATNINGIFHFGGCENFGNEFINRFDDIVRSTTERCDRLQNFNFVHSTFDKCCGLSSSALDKCREQYPSTILSTISIFPSKICFNPIEIYNTTFAIHRLIETSNFTLCYDYDALEKSVKQLQQDSSIQNYNEIIAETMLQSNCSSRFSGFNNGDIRKLSTNLSPFPRLHFLTCSFAPISKKKDLFEQLYQLTCPSNTYYSYPKEVSNTYFSQAIITRSQNLNVETNQLNYEFQNAIEWIPDGFLHIDCKVENRDFGETALHIGNQRSFGFTFQGISESFAASLKRKAFVHYYYEQGADEMDFYEAESNMNDLVTEYYDYRSISEYDYDYQDEEDNQ